MRNISAFYACTLLMILSIISGGNLFAQNIKDASLKTNVHPISRPVAMLQQLEPRTFEYQTNTYKHLDLPAGTHFGFMAEGLAQVIPGAVNYRNVRYMQGKNLYRTARVPQVNMEALIPLLVASVKEQQQQIEVLQAEVSALKQRLGIGNNKVE